MIAGGLILSVVEAIVDKAVAGGITTVLGAGMANSGLTTGVAVSRL